MAEHVYGAVSPDGQKMWGEGFEVKKISTGTYLVEFQQPFSSHPAPVCTVSGPPWQTFNMSAAIVDVNPTNFVYMTSTSNQPADTGISFVVVGPRK